MVPEMFLAVFNGLYPSLVMEIFISSKTFKQLTQLMTNIFSHGVQTDQVEISIELAKQFHSYKYYTRTMVDYMEELLFGKVKAELVGGGLVAETRAVLVDIMVIMGRQIIPGVKGKYIVSCEDSLLRGREELLEESVASEEEPKLLNNSKDHLESQVEAALLNSGYVCTFATDVQKIKNAMDTEC